MTPGFCRGASGEQVSLSGTIQSCICGGKAVGFVVVPVSVSNSDAAAHFGNTKFPKSENEFHLPEILKR